MAEGPREGGGTARVTVRDLMHTGVVTATPETTVASAADHGRVGPRPWQPLWLGPWCGARQAVVAAMAQAAQVTVRGGIIGQFRPGRGR